MTLSAISYAAGYTTGLLAFLWMARTRKLMTEGVIILMFAGLLGGLAFAGLTQRIIGGTAGKTVLGAIAGGYLCVAVCKKLLGVRRPLGDLFAIAISAGEILGRFGCYFGKCCYGKSCNLPWAVYQHGAFRHPTQIYLSLANFAILGILLIYNRKSPPENALFYMQAALYSIFRFVMEFWRETPPPVMGLSIAQWACIVGFLFFGYRFTKLRKCVPSLCPDAVSASKS